MNFTIGLSTLALALYAAGPPLARDKYDAFQKAADRSGCMAVPYPSERKLCKKNSEAQDRFCTDFSCDLEAASKAIGEIREIEEQIAAFDKLKQDENDYSRDLRKKLARLLEDFDSKHGDADQRAKRAHRCAEARQVVRSHFLRMKGEVAAEKSYGSKNFELYKRKIVTHFTEEELNHEKAIKNVRKARENCQKVAKMKP